MKKALISISLALALVAGLVGISVVASQMSPAAYACNTGENC